MAGRKSGSARARQKSNDPQEPVIARDASGTGADSRPSASASDDTQRISERAYELYLARGGAHGRDMDDWLAAEREIRNGRGDGPSAIDALGVDDPARRDRRRKQYEEGAELVSEID
jgi:hypothetical protein